MLDVGFSELLMILVAAVLFIGPKDYPIVIRKVGGFIRELRGIMHGVRSQVDQLMDESGINEIKQSTRTIIDLHGKEQQAFDVSELESLRAKKDGDA